MKYSEVGFSGSGFDVKAGEYPEDVADFNGVLITGSLSGVYDGDAWIQRLLNVRYWLRYSFLWAFNPMQRIIDSDGYGGVLMEKLHI